MDAALLRGMMCTADNADCIWPKGLCFQWGKLKDHMAEKGR